MSRVSGAAAPIRSPSSAAPARSTPSAAANAGPAALDVLDRAPALPGAAPSVPASTPTGPRRVPRLAALEIAAGAQGKVGAPVEVRFDVPGATRHKDDVKIECVLTSPSGKKVKIGGFATDGRHAVRFLPTEPGTWRYAIKADGGSGLRPVQSGVVHAADAPWKGVVRVDDKNPRALRYEDGTPFFPLGENRINIYDKKWNYDEMTIESYVRTMKEHGMSTLRVFMFADAVAEDRPKKDQLGCIEPEVGRFDERAAKRFDRIMRSAEKHGIQVILTVNAIGFTEGNETWKSWNDNPYNKKNGGMFDRPFDLFFDDGAKQAMRRKLDYVIDRWGASPALFGLDLLNEPEWDGEIPEHDWIPWAQEMAKHVRERDPLKRPVQVGSVGLHWNVGGDERPWWDSKECDVVQWHLYGPHIYDVHDLAAEMTRKIEETWNHGKPILVGEFGYGGEDRATWDHTHVGIWTATLSGAGALSHTAPPFTLDSDAPMTPERGAHFRALSTFLSGVDPKASLSPRPDLVSVDKRGARAWCLADGDVRAAWIMGAKRGYGAQVDGAKLTVKDLSPGTYRVEWIDDVTGTPLKVETLDKGAGDWKLDVPSFTRHVAVRIAPLAAVADADASRAA